VQTVSGTANRISSTGGANPVIDIDTAYVGQSSITTLGTITTGVWNGTTIAVANGGTGAVTLTNHGVLIGQTTSAIVATAAGTAGQVLQSGGAAADPLYSTATYPSTAAIGTVLYGSASNVISALAAPTVLGSNLGWNATNVYWQNAKNTVYFYDEFFGNGNTAVWNVSGTGAVSVNASTFPATSGHPGVWALQSLASTTGTASIALGSNSSGSIFFGGGAISINWIGQLSALSDATDTYSSRNGFSDAFLTTPSNGAYFTYTHGTNSGRWEIVTKKATATTTADSGIAADTNFHSFRIEVNAAGTSVSFYIDDVQTSNSPIATNIPVVILYPQANLVKSAGTTARAFVVDAFTLVQQLTTPR
jgi:hypothetical protein